MNRWTRTVDVTLLALLVITTASGGLAFLVGAEALSAGVVAVHGASGLGLLVLVPAKVRIARRGLRRPGRSRKVISLAFTLTVVLAVGSGLLHAIGGFRPYLGLLPMQVHVGTALAAAALLAGHVVAHHHRRRRRPLLRRTDVDRRVALRGAGVVAAAAVLWVLAPGRERRFTGSHEVGSGDPTVMPVTSWLFDPVPVLAAAQWRLRPPGRSLDLAALSALPQATVRAAATPAGGHADPPRDGGGGSSALRGARGPARLVVPGARGFWWVKWVVAVGTTDEPWWLQPPRPLLWVRGCGT